MCGSTVYMMHTHFLKKYCTLVIWKISWSCHWGHHINTVLLLLQYRQIYQLTDLFFMPQEITRDHTLLLALSSLVQISDIRCRYRSRDKVQFIRVYRWLVYVENFLK